MRGAGTCVLLIGMLLLPAAGCTLGHSHHDHGNSRWVVHSGGRHAPLHGVAHGHRRVHPHHAQLEIVFDAQLGVYTVVGHPGVHWDGERFWRFHDEAWWASAWVDGGWVLVHHERAPRGLARRHRALEARPPHRAGAPLAPGAAAPAR